MTAFAPAQISSLAPSWWISRGVVDPNLPSNDYAAANIGQAKNFAYGAYLEMEDKLASVGGAGQAIADLIASWQTPGPTTNDYAVVNVGQIKNLSGLFYQRLIELDVQIVSPWTSATSDDEDFALANIGQLKNAFNFDIGALFSEDSDLDGLTLLLELENNTDPENADTDADGLNDGDEINIYLTNPLNQDNTIP